MKSVLRYFLRFKDRGIATKVRFVSPNRKAYERVFKHVVERNKEALEALRDR